MYFFSTPIGSNIAILPLEKDYLHHYFLYYSIVNNPESVISMYRETDKIVILGGGTKENKELGEESLSRTIVAALVYINLKRYYNKTPEIIILGGNLKNQNNPTSVNMKSLIRSIDHNAKIILETESQDTYQNIKKLKGFLKLTDKAIIITSAFHMKRTEKILIHAFGKEFVQNSLTFIPVNFRYEYITTLTPYLFLPDMENIETTNIAFCEIVGSLYYALFYEYKKLIGK